MTNYEAAEKEAIAYLRSILRPVHYKELFRHAFAGSVDDYGPKTNPAEKFRQYYAEHDTHPILVIPGGDMAMRSWFPTEHQQTRIVPPDPLVIRGSCLVSYTAGYEHAKREQYLKDWYHDSHTEARYTRRMLAYQLEHHVRRYYLTNWPQFCLSPSNDGQWHKPASDDFRIRLPDGALYDMDVKSASYEEFGQGCYKARRIETGVVFIAGAWMPDTEQAVVRGIVPGRWLRNVAGLEHGDHFNDTMLMSFEVLSVMLNMAGCAMSWRDAYRKVA